MPNESNTALSKDDLDFVDGMAALLAPCDIPATAARLWAYLLLCQEPVSLDQIAADLEMSKSSACTAAQLLERMHSAVRHAERGSNRVLYGPSENYAGPLSAQSAMMDAIGKLLQGKGAKAASGPALKRVRNTAKFFMAMRDALRRVASEFDASR